MEKIEKKILELQKEVINEKEKIEKEKKEKEKKIENKIFTHGKHKGQTYKFTRINNPEYFMYLIAQPAGVVYKQFNYIKYCMEIMTCELDDEED